MGSLEGFRGHMPGKHWVKGIPVIGPILLWLWSILHIYPVRKTLFKLSQDVRNLAGELNSERRHQQQQWESQRHSLQRELEAQKQAFQQELQRQKQASQQESELQKEAFRQELDRQKPAFQQELQLQKQAFQQELQLYKQAFQQELEIGHQAAQEIRQQLARQQQALELQQGQLGQKVEVSEILSLHAKHGETEAAVGGLQTALSQCHREILFQQRRLNRILEEWQTRIPEEAESAALQKQILEEKSHALEAFYCAFEDVFRGDREDIKQRFGPYLAELELAGAGQTDAPVLDVGCGRGEWLEILTESGLAARGVDLNRTAIEECRRRGLDVGFGSAPDCFKEIPDETLGAVTGFHIVEHMPLEEVVALFDESFRVLKSGGMMIFETPNPENILVGACTFYNDPTHRNPLPPPVLQFMASQRGFVDVEIKRLHPYPDDKQVPADDELTRRFNELFYGAQDYAVVARKP